MKIHWKIARPLSIIILAFGIPSIALPEHEGVRYQVGTTPLTYSRVDQVVAQASTLRSRGDFLAEKAVLVDLLQRERPVGNELSRVFLRLADFFPGDEALKSQVVGSLNPEEAREIMQSSRARNRFDLEILVGEEFLRSHRSSPHLPQVRHDLAFSMMVADNQVERAMDLWEENLRSERGGQFGDLAKVYLEAVQGPESLRSLDAAHEIATTLRQRTQNNLRAVFANERIMTAAEKPFFSNYLSHPKVSNQDKAELLYRLMLAQFDSGHRRLAQESALKVLELVGYEGPLAENAAMTVGICSWISADYDNAIRDFDWFLRTYTESPLAPRASFYLSRVYLELGLYVESYIELRVLQEMYPRSHHADAARGTLASLSTHHEKMILAMDATAVDGVRVARLQQDPDPAERWQVTETNSANRFFTAEVDPQSKVEDRLAMAPR